MTRLIACMTTPGGLTGAPRRLLTLASVLNTEGVEVCIASESGSELLAAAEADGHKTAAVDAVGVLALRQKALFGGGLVFRLRVLMGLLGQNWRLYCCIRSQRGDVVWIRGSKGIGFGAMGALLSRRSLVWDVDYELPSRGMVRWLHRLGLWASKAVVFQYSAAPEAIFGQRLATRYSHKLRVLIPGIDLDSLEPFRVKRAARRKHHDNSFVILQVGTLCDRKNQRLIVEALSKLTKEGREQAVEVWFAGGVFDEGYAESLKNEVEARKLSVAFSFLGWRSDVHQLMVDADLLVMPSKDEGVPNTVQEAMAIGLPVLVSNAGGMPEVVRDGETGWILDRDDATAWAGRLQWCFDHREVCELVGQRGSEYAYQQFGTESWGAAYAQIVKGMTGAAPEKE